MADILAAKLGMGEVVDRCKAAEIVLEAVGSGLHDGDDQYSCYPQVRNVTYLLGKCGWRVGSGEDPELRG